MGITWGAGRLLLLTGERGAGKTTACARLAALAAERGLAAGGLLTRRLPGGLEAEAVPGGERWPLARLERPAGGGGSDGPPPDGPSVAPPGEPPEGPPGARREEPPAWGPFTFSPAGFERALRHLQRCLRDRPALLLLDEAGPLELVRGQGFRPFLEELLLGGPAGRAPAAGPALLLVVRPALLAHAARLLAPAAPGHPPAVVRLEAANRDGLPARLLAALLSRP